MKSTRLVLALATFATSAVAAEPNLSRFEYSEPHMGTTFRLVLYAESRTAADAAAKAAFARVEALNRIMSDYDPASELMRLCQKNEKTTGAPVPVSPELFFVLTKAREVSRLSDGAFDVTVGPVVKLWRVSRKTLKLPDKAALADALSRVGYKNIELNEKDRTVRLLKPGMQLDLGGIAKGYADDEMLAVLNLKHKITIALAAAGGDIAAGDAPPGAAGWKIDVAPLTKAKPEYRLLLANAAVSTSGDAEQHVTIDGVRYSHIVDPRTGLGQTGRRSVTVIAKHGITSDSMTKAMALMEPDKALKLIETIGGAATLIIRKTDTGEDVLESKRLAGYLAK
jgi:thiamine biosynthesis lipoprotein